MTDNNGVAVTESPADELPEQPHRAPDQTVFRNVVGHFASGVTVLTTVHDGKLYGTTASAVSSLSMEPPMMLACLNRTSSTHDAIAASRVFGINILSESQGDLAYKFGRSGGDKFEGVPLTYSEEGVPLIKGALATILCVVSETAAGGTHTIFLGEVLEAIANPGAPLTYFRGRFGRFEGGVEQIAYNGARQWVLHRTTPLGQPLDPEAIAPTLHVDPLAVENALIKLSAEALVERDAEGGFVATPLTVELYDNFYEGRAAIETGVIQGHFDKITDETVAELDALTIEMAKAKQQNWSLGDFLALHVKFHDALVSLAGSAQLVDTFRRLGIGTVWRAALEPGEWPAMLDHEPLVALVAALKDRDSAGAIAAIQRQTQLGKTLAHGVIERNGGRV